MKVLRVGDCPLQSIIEDQIMELKKPRISRLFYRLK